MGADGFFNKSILPKELFSKLKEIVDGSTLKSTTHAQIKTLLTEREKKVLIYVSQGFSHSDIAEKLELSKRTIETQLQSIYAKLYT
ncbi:hypothetical protein GH807_14370 [Acetobacterium tundrae]|uniref:HTH luxR-type domain-containing protein n=1 Tax=Acetobacterium tundrae TaxID=132932 RepID=A0ABR6WP81_9FIRM|nr:hypothetical protein [Acetobacterium tundrae]